MNSTPPPQTGLTLPFKGKHPTLDPSVFLAPGAVVIGDVSIGADSSVWFNSVLRGDVFHIRIGERVNIQDLTMIHVTTNRFETRIEDDVTIGHRVILHGCTIRRGALIGMGAIVMDQAEVGEFALVGAGSVVTPGTVIPPRTLALGSPARPRRPLTDEEVANLSALAEHYVATSHTYQDDNIGVLPTPPSHQQST